MGKFSRPLKPASLQAKQESKASSDSKSDYFRAQLIAWAYDPKRLGFLNLPAEIRLMIYPDLFTSQHRVQFPNGRHYYHPHYSVPTIFHDHDPACHQRVGPSSLTSRTDRTGAWEDCLYPEILSTCRTIHREALPLLEMSYYGENAFEFYLEPELESLPRSGFYEHYCPKIFEYRDIDWQEQRIPSVFQSSVFAAFLSKIGRVKAANIQHLSFRAEDCDAVADGLPIVKELAKLYLPGLRQLNIHVYEQDVCYSESPDYWHPDHDSPFWANGEFEPMYRALKDFAGQITWLKRFEYSGQCDFGGSDDGPVRGWDMLVALANEVWDRRLGEQTPAGSTSSSHDDANGKGFRRLALGGSESSSVEVIDDQSYDSDKLDSSGSEHDIEDLMAITGSIDFL